jgi:lipopolysaccharide heptosyltransferase I
MDQPSRILLIKPSSFGDIIHGLPVLAACKGHWPDAQIDWAVKREWAGLLTGHPLLRRAVFFPGTIWEGLRAWPALRRDGYDMVIDLQGLFRSGLYAALTGCPVRVGFDDGREGSSWFYSRRVKVSNDAVHAVERGLDMVRRIGVKTGPTPAFLVPDGKKQQEWVDDLWRRKQIRDGEAVCIVHPSARWATKRWPAERFAQLADGLIARERMRIIIVGSAAEASQIEEMSRQMSQPAINLAGQTDLLQLAALLRRANLLVSNDSGPIHLAAAVGTSVVAIFGPTDPSRVGPYGDGHVVLRKDVDCSRCTRRACIRDALCMKAISVSEVFEAVRAVVNRSKGNLAAAAATEVT